MTNKMEFFNLLIDVNALKNTCFLCFKTNKNNTNIYEDIEIEDEYFTLTISLVSIMKNMFPANEPLLGQACDDCTSVLLKMFLLIHKNYLKKVIFEEIIDKTNDDVDMNVLKGGKKRKELKINLNLSTIDSVLENGCNSSRNFNKDLRKDNTVCKNCNMTFYTKKELQKHVKVRHRNNNNAIVCDVCGITCKTPISLNAHLNTHIQKECPYCFKSLKNHSHFKVHVRNHETNVRRQRTKSYFYCNNCSYKSVNKSSLEAHMNKQHLHLRPYVCQICFKGFYKNSNLKEHTLIHDKSKGHTCDVCGDNFVSKKTLTDHLRLHKGEKTFKCSECDEKFINSGRRLEHMKRKHMEKSECCNICNKKFSLKRSLNVHMKMIHYKDSEMSNTLCWG